MIRLTVTLIVAIYILLIVIPGADHADDGAVESSGGTNWLVALISNAEANAQTPPRAAVPRAGRTVRTRPEDILVDTPDGLALETADGERLLVSAVIDPVALLAEANAAAIASISVAEPVAAAPEAGAAETADIVEAAAVAPEVGAVAPSAPPAVALAPVSGAPRTWRVVGDRVNFRAGPSTDTAVLAALNYGEEVEYLADAPDDWAHLRVISSGLEGYMAARFIEPVN
jgi:hypothetical protein